ncbi:hypothetical protein B0I31_12437 [Saccharothrix carnea]|uniref:Uncharacterized protein n=1 Tax=Saccharothrix carnea TaxID=1280637 RepID=A0A2P8HR14_SACCR|nr:hypothetical protein B0I31_12437 [Saccharothrix carnea]
MPRSLTSTSRLLGGCRTAQRRAAAAALPGTAAAAHRAEAGRHLGRRGPLRDHPARGGRGDPARHQDTAVDLRGHLPGADDRVTQRSAGHRGAPQRAARADRRAPARRADTGGLGRLPHRSRAAPWRTPTARHARSAGRGDRADRGLHVPARPAARALVVPRPPDGLHRPGGLARPGRAARRPRRRRGPPRPARRAARAATDDHRPRVRRGRQPRLPVPRPHPARTAGRARTVRRRCPG